MQVLWKLYDRLVDGMALTAAILLVWLMVAVTASVVMRNLGAQPFAWLFTSTEYAMLYITMLGAPWLVRQRGHVHIELVTAALPAPARIALSRAVAAACTLICLYLGWKGYQLVQTNLARGDFDVRSYYFPRWLLTIAFPVSFGLMAVECARFVFGREVMHSGEAGIHE
ncbi:TRAP transporter small permease [Pseudotabrizicola formosa]|uniref:TRAP transporter small permease n=1 Tax=Pseudotabrizicola formosa TaxID=2030009 RepID=UPI000CD1A381|nr:TRAP transporter small permease subunit [Pseudotabrizicola formosa]